MKLPSQDQRRKIILVILLGIAVITLLLLASGLSELNLRRGSYLIPEKESVPQVTQEATPGYRPPRNLPDFEFLYLLAPILFWGLIIYAGYLLFFQKDKSMLRMVGSLAALVGLILLLQQVAQVNFGELAAQLTPIPTGGPGTIVPAPGMGDVDRATSFLLGFSVLMLFMLLVYFLWRRAGSRSTPQEQIVDQAQRALDDLSRGLEIENIIMRCYYQMSETLQKQRGISRSGSMTPREFEDQLIQLGFPENNVRELTRLFEKVRYGDLTATEDEEAAAVQALKMIIQTGEQE
jgi:hypothetical protein